MKSFINILIYEKKLRIIIHLAYVANCISPRHLRKYIMNKLYWIAFALFAITLYAVLNHYVVAFVLLFIASVSTSILAVYADDRLK